MRQFDKGWHLWDSHWIFRKFQRVSWNWRFYNVNWSVNKPSFHILTILLLTYNEKSGYNLRNELMGIITFISWFKIPSQYWNMTLSCLLAHWSIVSWSMTSSLKAVFRSLYRQTAITWNMYLAFLQRLHLLQPCLVQLFLDLPVLWLCLNHTSMTL